MNKEDFHKKAWAEVELEESEWEKRDTYKSKCSILTKSEGALK